MKRLILGLTIPILLVGCSESSMDKVQAPRFKDNIKEYKIITDNETGCKYLIRGAGSYVSMSPLYNKDGKVEGCGKTK